MEIELHDFTVAGHTAFPYDMLRYDCCWPRVDGSELYTNPPHYREIKMRGTSMPTTDRWRSFGWVVLNGG